MIFNRLGNTDIQLSAVGLGAWAIGGGGYKYGWGSQEDKDSIATIRRAVEMGINWVDTAPVYGNGHSEKIVGEAIKGLKEEVIVSTKCGLRMAENNEDLLFNLSEEGIRAEVEASLKRLNKEAIDLYMIHIPEPDEDLEKAWKVLGELKKEGKIRYAGGSNFTLNQLKRIQPIHPVSFIEPEYSMLETSIEGELLEYCAANNIGIISYSPMYRGLLTGKFTKERAEALPEDDNRLTLDYFRQPFITANLELVERLRTIAGRNNKTVAQLSIAWVLRRPEVTSAIVGARRPDQIEQTAPAGDWVLSDEDKAELDNILSEHYARLEKLKG